jgi:transcriptional regulator with XRE-family HTH domain
MDSRGSGSITGAQLRDHRRAQHVTQRQLAEAWGVNANTIARWERDELPIPVLVGVLLAAHRAADEAHRHVRTLHDHVKDLTSQITRLTLRNLALEHHLRQRRARRVTPMIDTASHDKSEQVFKRLVRKYHPDRHPAQADVMKDINELMTTIRANRHRG